MLRAGYLTVVAAALDGEFSIGVHAIGVAVQVCVARSWIEARVVGYACAAYFAAGRYRTSLKAWDDRGDRLACLRRNNMVEVVL